MMLVDKILALSQVGQVTDNAEMSDMSVVEKPVRSVRLVITR